MTSAAERPAEWRPTEWMRERPLEWMGEGTAVPPAAAPLLLAARPVLGVAAACAARERVTVEARRVRQIVDCRNVNSKYL